MPSKRDGEKSGADITLSQDGIKVSMHGVLYRYVSTDFYGGSRDGEKGAMPVYGDITLARHAGNRWHFLLEAKVKGIPRCIGNNTGGNEELYKRSGTVTLSQSTGKLECVMDPDDYTALSYGKVNYANCSAESDSFIGLENIAPIKAKRNRLVFSVLGTSFTIRNADGILAFDIDKKVRVTENPSGSLETRKLETREINMQRFEDIFSIKRTANLKTRACS
jgi:hypothetical protein